MTTPAHAQRIKKNVEGLPRQQELSQHHSCARVCMSLFSTVLLCRDSTIQMRRLNHHTSDFIVAPSQGLEEQPLLPPRMWHVCASLANTHCAWRQPTHPRTSYHKLEGLSPGRAGERLRCMYVCGVSFLLQWLGKTPRCSVSAPFELMPMCLEQCARLLQGQAREILA